MSDGGKGSAPRPFSVTQEEYAKRWDAIFQRDGLDDNTGVTKNEFQDILSTEDCFDGETDKVTRYNEETQQVKK
jgi:hypothetical protein